MSIAKRKNHPKLELVKRSLFLLGALLLLYMVFSSLWGVVKPNLVKNAVEPVSHQLEGEVSPLSVTDPQVPIRKGNVNGDPIAVPVDYLHSPIEYKDKSVWETPKRGDKKLGERTFEDAVSAFSVYVRWRDLKPRNSETEKSFRDGRNKPEEYPWLSIGVTAYDSPQAKGRDLGWAPVLRGILDRLSKEELARVPRRIIDPTDPKQERRIGATDLSYALHGVDPVTGLHWAEPVGIGTERFYTWNKVLYWQGDMNGIVTDLIECYNGKMPNPKSYHKCNQKYTLLEWGASVSVSYPRVLLSHWREIKSNTRKLILSFQYQAEPTTNANNRINKESK